jgi:hypothetical protein
MRDRLMSWKARARTALPPRVQMDAARTTYFGGELWLLVSQQLTNCGACPGAERGRLPFYFLVAAGELVVWVGRAGLIRSALARVQRSFIHLLAWPLPAPGIQWHTVALWGPVFVNLAECWSEGLTAARLPGAHLAARAPANAGCSLGHARPVGANLMQGPSQASFRVSGFPSNFLDEPKTLLTRVASIISGKAPKAGTH